MLLFFVITAANVIVNGINSQGIVGMDAKCDAEGEEVYVPLISSNPCFSCYCEQRRVKCDRETCDLEGCHVVLFTKPKNSCCNVCKGCVYKGRKIKSGEEFTDASDPCTVISCKAAVLNIRKIQCHVPCRNPIHIPGQCCPSCSGCSLGRRKIKEGDVITLKRDQCVYCVCKGGNVTCSKISCPVLNCPSKFIYHPEKSCCPICRDQRKVFDLPTRCLLKNKVYREGQVVQFNRCTTCVCQNATSVCERISCPPVTCSPEFVVYEKGRCCPVCQLKRRCRLEGRRYRHGKSWKPNICTSCNCDNGVTRCHVEQCSNSLGCPKNYELKYREDECCPRCVEKESTCTVFGDPHYKSFDGRIFNYQGTCKYILAQDCQSQAFSVRVRNYSRLANSFAWTKYVILHIGGLKLSLLQNLVVKCNRKRVQLPFVKEGVLIAERVGNSVEVRTNIGVRLFWDGNSFLEVTVPAKFKSLVCGLCGNYNGAMEDDFKDRDNIVQSSAQLFADSWRYGTTRACQSVNQSEKRNRCQRDSSQKREAEEYCSLLKSETFRGCHGFVDVHSYVRSCIVDECECPLTRMCACESFKAYARECDGHGLRVPWENVTSCSVSTCPRGMILDPCGASCHRTCQNLQNTSIKCSADCRPGCTCPIDRVLHNNACILPKNCPGAR